MNDAPDLWISRHLVERIRRHGAETYPHECCGALLGRDNSVVARGNPDSNAQRPQREVLALFPLINRREDSPRNRFSVTPADVLAAEKEAVGKGMDVIGWYHSHPDHPARPSEYDREHAWPWYSYVIIAVSAGAPQEMTSWRLADDRAGFSPEEIEICDRATV